MADEGLPEGAVGLSLKWENPENPAAVLTANQFAVTITTTGEVIFVVGQFVPPIFSGAPEEVEAQVRDLGDPVELPVRQIARFGLSPTAVTDLAALMERTVARLQAIPSEAGTQMLPSLEGDS